MKENFSEAKKLIDSAQNILLVTHRDPDVDGLGSMLALDIALIKMGKNPTVFSPSSVPLFLKFLPGAEKIKYHLDNSNFDLIIGFDYGNFDRLELNQIIKINHFLTFDHHLIGKHIGLQIVNGNSSSTAEIIYYFLDFLKIPIDQAMATCLLAGIFDDTGGFFHANTTAQTLKIAGELMLKGAPLSKIAKASAQFGPQKKLKTWTKALQNFKTDTKTGLAYSLISYQDLTETNNHFATSNIINFLSAIPGVKVALLLTEKIPGYFEGSLRTQKDRGVDAASLAQTFGGGGHKLAAGFQINGDLEKIINKIKALLTTNSLPPKH